MKAAVGDRIVMPGRHVGDSERAGEVLEVQGPDGRPPYLVRWDDRHEAIVYPGPEARLVHQRESTQG